MSDSDIESSADEFDFDTEISEFSGFSSFEDSASDESGGEQQPDR